MGCKTPCSTCHAHRSRQLLRRRHRLPRIFHPPSGGCRRHGDQQVCPYRGRAASQRSRLQISAELFAHRNSRSAAGDRTSGGPRNSEALQGERRPRHQYICRHAGAHRTGKLIVFHRRLRQPAARAEGQNADQARPQPPGHVRRARVAARAGGRARPVARRFRRHQPVRFPRRADPYPAHPTDQCVPGGTGRLAVPDLHGDEPLRLRDVGRPDGGDQRRKTRC